MEVVKIGLDGNSEVEFSNGIKQQLKKITRDSHIASKISGGDGILIGEHRGWEAANKLLTRKDQESASGEPEPQETQEGIVHPDGN